MSLSEIGLLISFIAEAVKSIKKFMRDAEVRKAFDALKKADTDEQKQAVAQDIATLLYRA